MNDEEDPLIKWNSLNISNAERELVKALLIGTISSSTTIDRYSSWLLAGIAGSAALLITGIGSILPYLSEDGFRFSGALLVVAGSFGFLAKLTAVQVSISLEQEGIIAERMSPVFDRHGESEEEIRAHAEARGISLDTDVDINRVIGAFISSFPSPMRKYLRRTFEKGLDDPHFSQKQSLRSLLYQSLFAGLQTLFFIFFVIVAVLYASAI